MRYTRGSKVEVLNTREVPSGSWWPAEIISGDGHYYNVIYDQCPPDMSTDVIARVSRRVIRPCPPMQSHRIWARGDIVEAFSNGSWKCAEVLRVSCKDEYIVRVLGCSQALKAQYFSLRLCLSWQDNEWLIRQDAGEILRRTTSHKKTGYKLLKSRKEAQKCPQNVSSINDLIDSSTTKKRRLEALKGLHAPASRKLRARGSNIKQGQPVAGIFSRFSEKVDAVVSPQKLLGENYMHASYNDRTGYSGMDTEWEKQNTIGCSRTRFEHNYAENDTLSICSSSGSNSPDKVYHSKTVRSLGLDECSEGAYSFCRPRSGEKQLIIQVDMAAEVHEVELHAYRSTMEALYASGPLSWEKEEMISNLRLMLHITNDEHLLELRHLKSSCSSTPN